MPREKRAFFLQRVAFHLRPHGAVAPTNFELIDKTTEILPGITLIALVSEAPGTRELKELSLAINTPDGVDSTLPRAAYPAQ